MDHEIGPEEEIIFFETGWEQINKVGIQPFLTRVECFDTDELDTKPNPMQEFLSTYDTVFAMCIQREPYNYSDRLYEHYKQAFIEYYRTKFIAALEDAKKKSELFFLKEFVRRWKQNQYAVLGMQRMFCYLDRFFVPNAEELKPMKEFGYDLYREHVFDHFKALLRTVILKCIKAERDGVEQNRELLRECVMTFVQLGHELNPEDLSIYIDDFQDHLLQETTEYYRVASEKWRDSLSCPDFLIRAEQAVNEELKRIQAYLHSSTETSLMREVRVQILKFHQTKILESNTGIVNMLRERCSVDLGRIFELYKEVENGLEPIAAAVQKHICDLGQGFIRDSKSDGRGNKENKHTLVRNLIQLHDRFLKIMKNEFQSHREFTKAMKNSFEFFINQEYYVSNYLARYVNDFLRKGGVGVNYTDEQLEEQMVHIVMLYSYIRDKDVFENNYRGYLANRLLSDTSASEQMEKKMIGKLKQESGYHWTQKLEDMFTDIQKSKDLIKVFQRDPRGQNLDTTLNVSVCTQGAWPSTNVTNIIVPNELEEVVDRFTNFYQERHVGRKLNFRWDKGTAEVVVRFSDKTEKVLVVSTYQMAVLLLFNRANGPILTYQDIIDKTGIEDKDLQVAVLSLAHPKSKILLKRPNGPKIEGGHKLRINFKFAHPQKRIIVPMLKTVKQQQKDADETQQQVQVQRRHQVDAAIVRIMKARKQLNHPSLISDVHNQLASRFDAQPSLIKQRIQALIELEYLERDEDDRSLYMYKQ